MDKYRKPADNRKRKQMPDFRKEKSSETRPSYSRRRNEDEGKRKPRYGEDPESDLIRLNRYIANAGICSRREADKLIQAGAVQVNGKVVTELGTKVSRTDKISYGDQTLSREKLRYVLLNKPKGFITTTDDPENRKTVMNLIARACKERIYPVGRLDRNTTGLLLFTNDGEIAKRLSHPRYGIKKIYHVGLDKNVSVADMKSILAGVELEDGLVKADAIEFVGDGKDKKEIGLELHTGQNRVVRRIFEKLGYKVVKLDRVYYAGLTKKNLPRGEWRFLEEKELNMLKMIGASNHT
jgi:23S rRNA pseudouridine2605 synthase